MELTLSENIRTFRKQRKLTQEKLAEALGVTVGAVYKWESGLSQPELNLIVELADFFDTSVDVLLGYRARDNRLESTLERIRGFIKTLDPEALAEAEKAIGKYPHSFEIVYNCAHVYLAFGAGNHDKKHLERAIELLEQAIILLPQNSDPRLNASIISGGIASAWLLLGKNEKALELLRQNNAGGVFSDQIGTFLSVYMGHPEEAVPYLSEGMMSGLSSVMNAVLGYVFVFISRGDYRSALEITAWGEDLLSGLKTEDRPDFIDKTKVTVLVLHAYVQRKAGEKEKARETLENAGALALRFDSNPDYSLSTMRFTENPDRAVIFDVFGATAAGSVAGMLKLLGDDELSRQWKEITENGK